MGSSWFYSRVGDVGRVQDFIVLFLMLINEMKEQDLFLRGHRDGKILLRSNESC